MAVTTMKKGAMDFIPKPFKEEELLSVVERMLDQAREAFADYQHAANRDALMGKLTARESQVLERIVAGRLNKQIADDLGISIKTVEAHRANIMEKLNANTVADLLKIALGPFCANKSATKSKRCKRAVSPPVWRSSWSGTTPPVRCMCATKSKRVNKPASTPCWKNTMPP
jgi:DNA-binding CsgD family transcriptional regulator